MDNYTTIFEKLLDILKNIDNFMQSDSKLKESIKNLRTLVLFEGTEFDKVLRLSQTSSFRIIRNI